MMNNVKNVLKTMNIKSNGMILFSFVMAFVLSLLPLPIWVREIRPEWILLVLTYWQLALPYRISMLMIFSLGIFVDILQGSLLGMHASAFVIVAYLIAKFCAQVRMFPLWQQAAAIFCFALIYQLIIFWIKNIIGQMPHSSGYWLASVSSAIVWPWIFLLLQNYRRYFQIT